MANATSISTIIASLALIGNQAIAMTEAEYDLGVDKINQKYQSVYDSAEREGNDIKEESGTCLLEAAFDADWEITKVSFDLPEVTFKNRDFSFHTVKTKFRNKVIAKTKVPKTYFEVRDIGFGIKTKVPIVRMEIKEIKTKVPEFKWERTGFKTKIPEFRSRRVEWKFHILKIKKLKELNVPCKEEEKRANRMSATVSASSEQHKSDLNKHTMKYIAFNAEKLSSDIASVESEFNRGINSMDAAIRDVKNNGIDPSGVIVEFEGEKTTMVGARDVLVRQKADVLAKMREAHRQLIATLRELKG